MTSKEVWEGLHEASAKLSMLKGSCEGLDHSGRAVKVTSEWFNGAAMMLKEIRSLVDDAIEFIDNQAGEKALMDDPAEFLEAAESGLRYERP